MDRSTTKVSDSISQEAGTLDSVKVYSGEQCVVVSTNTIAQPTHPPASSPHCVIKDKFTSQYTPFHSAVFTQSRNCPHKE